ncbi:uncharacterized protein LOC129985099 [Argiope bruennichi]|uniref:uncharacterized protein LOC129985099 n=1 Tax=Argiope bruennichi TaxID=94029 RepID=UPI002494815F|nr:uncharacterized protein LOC129985099 [Argiope bruennichi]
MGLKKEFRRHLYFTVAERMILHGASAWAYPLSSRQQRILISIQRKFLLSISGAFRTTSTAALQVIKGILPLHIKTQAEATYVRVSRLQLPSHFQNISFPPENFEMKCSHTKIFPSDFLLEDRISLKQKFQPTNKTDIFTDGSKIEGKTGFAYCVFQNEQITHQWLGKLNEKNSVFQAELLVIKEACKWASKFDHKAKIWSWIAFKLE